MTNLAPHLLLRTDEGSSRAAALLRRAGYLVSRIEDDDLALRLANAEHIDAVVVELPARTAISFAQRAQGRVAVVITSIAEHARRARPDVAVLTPGELTDDLVSTTDLALAALEMGRTA